MGMPDDYCELHAHTNFSFLDGASHPEELIARAALIGVPAKDARPAPQLRGAHAA
jgi:DNA polymerase III alpha subunit (gram-positive type)